MLALRRVADLHIEALVGEEAARLGHVGGHEREVGLRPVARHEHDLLEGLLGVVLTTCGGQRDQCRGAQQ